MKTVQFRGLGVTLPTPFVDRGAPIKRMTDPGKVTIEYPEQINLSAFQTHLRRLVEQGPDFLVVCDVAGESPTLNYAEHVKMIAETVKIAGGKIPVLAATGANSTIEAIELSRAAKFAKADGLLVVTPYYIRPPLRGLTNHYRTIRREVKEIPIILYDNPARTGINVNAETILELAHEGTIQGVKLASGDSDQAEKIITDRPPDFTVLVGDDRFIYRIMRAGADGAISVIANFAFPRIRDLVVQLLEERYDDAKTTFKEMQLLMATMEIEINPLPLKTALSMIYPNQFSECFRSPLCPMEPEKRLQIEFILRHYCLI